MRVRGCVLKGRTGTHNYTQIKCVCACECVNNNDRILYAFCDDDDGDMRDDAWLDA